MESLFSDFELDWTKDHPVSNVQWIKSEYIQANDYNPNTVAKPEMELLRLSIEADGYTQPIVVWQVENNIIDIIKGICFIVSILQQPFPNQQHLLS